MKKHVLLAGLAVLAVGNMKLQAGMKEITVKNASDKHIFVAISHTKCKIEADVVGYISELTSGLGYNLSEAEELKGATKNFAAGVKVAKGRSKDCQIKYIESGESESLSVWMPEKLAGIGPSGFSVHIGDKDGNWILKKKDVKFGKTVTWNGTSLE